jgi:hypothetical protein
VSVIQLPLRRKKERVPALYYCELDGWNFNPRYTEGACPICGWKPDGAPPTPRWLAVSRKVDWDVVALFALFVFLTFWAVIVAQAAHLHIPLIGR